MRVQSFVIVVVVIITADHSLSRTVFSVVKIKLWEYMENMDFVENMG